MERTFTCADCQRKPCRTHETDKYPGGGCPTARYGEKFFELYGEDDLKISRAAARTESAGYCRWCRLEEIMFFAGSMGYRRLGVAFCAGLSEEARKVVDILRENGFDVRAAVCKCGSIPKERLGLLDEEKNRPGQFEAMCNPAGQAQLLEEAGTEFNLLVGLCVGHDTLFIRYTHTPVTTFAVKDRALGHNPLAAVYLSDGFFKRVHMFMKDHPNEDTSKQEECGGNVCT